jgi:hypothetical protein
MVMYSCPLCGKEVKILSMGEGWVGTCCNQIIYNSKYLPKITVSESVSSKGALTFSQRG